MPADKVLTLTPQQIVDVLAYILSRNHQSASNSAISQELGPDRNAMHSMLLSPRARVDRRSAATGDTGYFSEEQAERGEQYFKGSCEICHIAAQKRPSPGGLSDPLFSTVSLVESGGVSMGPIHLKIHVAGPDTLAKFPSVGAFYRRIKFTMPMHDPAGLDDETYLDIVAYLLKASGLPAGNSALPADDERLLDAMPILEPGFQALFNGKDFSGLRFIIGAGCGPPPDGCASEAPGQSFVIKHGSIYTTGYPNGYMYTAKKYLNFTLRFEYRFSQYPGAQPEDVYSGNSGYMLFITKSEVWPKSIEIEGYDPTQLRPLGLASNPVFTYDTNALQRARHQTGEWNAVEIESNNGHIRCSLNGTLISVVTQHEFKEAGYIGFQAEDARITWRNLRIREEQ